MAQTLLEVFVVSPFEFWLEPPRRAVPPLVKELSADSRRDDEPTRNDGDPG